MTVHDIIVHVQTVPTCPNMYPYDKHASPHASVGLWLLGASGVNQLCRLRRLRRLRRGNTVVRQRSPSVFPLDSNSDVGSESRGRFKSTVGKGVASDDFELLSTLPPAFKAPTSSSASLDFANTFAYQKFGRSLTK